MYDSLRGHLRSHCGKRTSELQVILEWPEIELVTMCAGMQVMKGKAKTSTGVGMWRFPSFANIST